MFREGKIKKTKKEILKSFNLDKIESLDWDEDTFLESYYAFKKKLDKVENREELLVRFFEDSLFVKKDEDCSEYEDEFSMSPFKDEIFLEITNWQTGLKISGGNVSKLATGREAGTWQDSSLEKVQYGPTKVFNVKPGQFIFIPKKEFTKNDILGSNEFTGCSVISFKTDKGYFFAHITTGVGGVKELLEKLKQDLSSEIKINLIRPEWKEGGEIKKDYEKHWQKLEQDFPNVKVSKYAYIAMNSDRPADINDTSILMTKDKLMTIGTNFYPGGRREFNYETLQIPKFSSVNTDLNFEDPV